MACAVEGCRASRMTTPLKGFIPRRCPRHLHDFVRRHRWTLGGAAQLMWGSDPEVGVVTLAGGVILGLLGLLFA